MTKYTILIEGQTVGYATLENEPEIGQLVTIELNDHNGNTIKKKGKVVDFLESSEY